MLLHWAQAAPGFGPDAEMNQHKHVSDSYAAAFAPYLCLVWYHVTRLAFGLLMEQEDANQNQHRPAFKSLWNK